MQSSKALSVTPYVNDWLANSHHPRILHLFDNVCNLINEYGEVLSVVTPQVGNGPFNIVVEDNICLLNHCDIQSQVYFSSLQLNIGSLVIYTTDVKLWNPYPAWNVLHAKKDDIRHQLTPLLVRNSLNTADLARQGFPLLQSLVSNLSLALVNADISLARKVTSQLAGLGAGLTPSGDDLIMGAIYATWIIHPFEIGSLLAREVADMAAPRTTSLSAAWLRAAGRGEAGIVWHQFFDALLSQDRMDIEGSMKNILAVGETSGADALAGFMSVFAASMQGTGSSHA